MEERKPYPPIPNVHYLLDAVQAFIEGSGSEETARLAVNVLRRMFLPELESAPKCPVGLPEEWFVEICPVGWPDETGPGPLKEE